MDIKTSFRRAKHAVFLFLSIFLICFVSASHPSTEYADIGGDSSYTLGNGLFTSLNTDAGVTASVETSSPSAVPLMGDMNGDGIIEIIAFDGTTIRVFNGNTLSFASGFSMFRAIRGQPSLFDIDGDNDLDLLIFQNNQSGFINLSILKYNGSILTETEYSVTTLSSASGRVLDYSITCRDSDSRCLAIMEVGNSATSDAVVSMESISFDNTGIHDTELLASSGINCLSIMGDIVVDDIDYDGTEEFISNFFADWAVSASIITYQMNINSSGNISQDRSSITDSSPANFASGEGCFSTNRRIKNMFTNVLVMEVDGANYNNGKEIAYIIPTSSNHTSYQVRVYHMDGSLYNTYPEAFFIELPRGAYEGTISNLFVADVLGTGLEDFCFTYISTVTNLPEMLCNSQLNPTPFGTDSVTYTPVSSYVHAYNATNLIGNYSVFITASHTVTDIVNLQDDGHDARDILNSYGIWTVDDNTCTLGGFLCYMNLSYSIPQSNVFAVQVDAENNGHQDIILQSRQALYYLDDGFSNTHCDNPEIYSCIDADTVTIRPCIDRIWAVNTSVSIEFTVNDFDTDNVAGRAILYYGNSNAQDSGWTANFSSGHPFTFSGFTANLTGNNFIFRIMARDTDNPLAEEIIDDISFDVGTDGVTHGQCTTTGIINPEVVNEADITALGGTSVRANNSIQNVLDGVSIYTGMGTSLLWLFFMLLLAIMIIFLAIRAGWTAGHTSAIIGICESFMLLIGFYVLGFGGGIVITLVVVGLALLAIFGVGFFNRGSSGGG